MRPRTISFLFACAALFGNVVAVSAASTPVPQQVDRYGNTPMLFEPNVGQTTSDVRYVAHGARYGIFLTREGTTLDLSEGGAKSVALKLAFSGSGSRASISGEQPLPSRSNYFVGALQNWHSDVPNYARVRYAAVYPGVDAVFYGNQRQLEYDFDVAPNADPSQIGLRVTGADKLSINPDGSLKIDGDGRVVTFHAPVAFQTVNGVRREVASRYVLKGCDEIRFAIGDYDRTQPLIIDPTLVYSSFLGGSNYESAYGVALDGSGNAYLTGFTQSADFPKTVGVFTTDHPGAFAYVFVSKVNASGSGLVYSTYFGGSTGAQQGNAIAVDGNGNAYIGGVTSSSDFPATKGAVEPAHSNTYQVGFVTKLNASGNALVYSTYVGVNTSGGAGVNGIDVDGSGYAYITGGTTGDFPVTSGAFQKNYAGNGDAFVAKLNNSGSAYDYASYLGGGYLDVGNAITVDGNGNAYVTGFAECNHFPSTSSAYQKDCDSSGQDVFVVKMNQGGSAMVYGTFLHARDGIGNAIALDVYENAYVTGSVGSGMPTTPGAFQATAPGNGDAFVAKINSAGTALAYATYLGGNGDDLGYGIKVDLAGRAYVTGVTIASTNFPVTSDAYQPHLQQGPNPIQATNNAFLTRFNAEGTALDYSTYFGSGYTDALALALDITNNVYFTGLTFPNGIPVTPNAFDNTGKAQDAYITKFAFGTATSCIPASAGAEICSPAKNSTDISPVQFTWGAKAQPGLYIAALRIYVDNMAEATSYPSGAVAEYQTTETVSLSAGTHDIVGVAYESNGSALTVSESITVK
jgi:hypothetical protein